MRKKITLYDDQYKFFKTFNSQNLLIAFIEYMFEDIEPSNLNDTEMVLFESLRVRMDNQKKKSRAGAIWWVKSRWWWRPKKQRNNNETTNKEQADNKQETSEKQAKNKEDKDNITNVILLKDKDKEEDNKIKEIHTEIDMCNKLHDEYWFDLFWSKYPVKKDKKKAMQKFNKMNAEKRKSAIEWIERLKQSDSWKRWYIPLPTTYLNGERREDEVETRWSSYSFEQMKERERQRRMEQAREILTPKQTTNGNASETQATNRRANIVGM